MNPTPAQLANSEAAAWGLVRAHKQTIATLERELAESRAREARLRVNDARYRLLRRGQKWSVINGIGDDLRAERLDAEVDAALQQKGDTNADV